MIGSNKNKCHGSAIAYVLVIMTMVSIVVVSMLGFIVSQLRFSSSRVQRESAFQVSEAGIYYYRWYLAHQLSGKDAQQIKNFWQAGNPIGVATDYESEWNDPGGGAIGKYSIHVDPPDPYSTIVTVTSTGWTYDMPNTKRVIRARFRRPSWSEYAVLANNFMRFGTGTNVYGKIHSNGGIRFDGVAHNTITSKVATCISPDGDDYHVPQFGVYTHVSPTDPFPPAAVPVRPDVFQAGRQFPVANIDFNGLVSSMGYMKDESQIAGHGKYFDNSGEGRHIILNTNGTMNVRLVNSYDKNTYDNHGNVSHKGTNSITSETSGTNYPIPDNGVIFVEDNAWVEGAVNGKKITIVAANLLGGAAPNVYIGMNNITYSNFDGRDIIGLIAQNNVEVIRDSQDYLIIDAALVSQSGRVGRDYYSPWCTSYNRSGYCSNLAYDHRNTITINGSIATNLRYGFAYTDGTGYTNRVLNFDNNLLYYPPPYFPTGTEYSIDLWEEL